MYKIGKTFRFEAAHQLDTAFTKECHESIHGHSYVVEVVICSDKLDKDGMVVDFGKLKGIIDATRAELDHSLILSSNRVQQYGNKLVTYSKKVVYFQTNPTAEAMAEKMFHYFDGALCTFNGPWVQSIRVHETATGWAEYVRPEPK